VDLQPARKQRHGARSSWLSVASKGALASAICTVTNVGTALGFDSCFQRNSTRAAIPYRRATSERLAPGCPACSTMRRLSASLKVRRWPSRAGGMMSGCSWRAVSHMTNAMTKGMTKPMTKPAAPVKQLARPWLRLSFELRPPIAKRLERKPVSLTILSLIQIALPPRLMVCTPKGLAVTLARPSSVRHLFLLTLQKGQ